MSTHPNAILLLVLTPDNFSRKTYRDICSDIGLDCDDDPSFKLAGSYFSIDVMEDDYDEHNQISAKEGDLVVWCFVTYGYGDRVEWDDLQEKKNELDDWAKKMCARHACKYQIYITANYW